jgi:hypothetical protein
MKMADDWVRLAMALVIIALISVGMYSFSSRASAIGPLYGSASVRHP